MSQQEKIIIHTDGGSRGNPGPSAIGVIIEATNGNTLHTISRTIGTTTNNVAEYTALREALLWCQKNITCETEIEIFLDSELLARQLSGQYKVKDERLKPFYLEIKQLITNYPHLTITHVKRELNKGADLLVNNALDAQL